MKNKKIVAIVSLSLAAVLVVAGTFAWFSSKDSVKNILDMDAFDVTITEAFDPNTPVTPGAEITKEVGVTNNGNVPVVVRVRFQESLELLTLEQPDNTGKLQLVYHTTKNATGNSGFTKKDGTEATVEGTVIPAKVSQALLVTVTASPWQEVSGAVVNTQEAGGTALTGVKVYRKETATGNNKVYNFFAYDPVDNQLVEVLPTGADKGTTTTFTGRYAYHVKKKKDAPTDTGYHQIAEYEKEIDNYLAVTGKKLHDFITLNFADKVAAFTATTTDKDKVGTAGGQYPEYTDADTYAWVLNGETATGGKGFYYYSKVLGAGQSTPALLTKVSFVKDIPNQMQGAVYTLTPVMEAVQAEKEAVKATWTAQSGEEVDPTGSPAAKTPAQLIAAAIDALTPQP